MLKSKKMCCVFTIVKNESFFLPIWHKYYLNYFEDKDIFILDHESTDGSTIGYKNVKIIKNEFTQDNQWLIKVTKDFQKELLLKYDYVLFTNVDEIICPDPHKYDGIIDYLKNNKKQEIFRCNGSEVLNFPEENKIEYKEKILKQRNFWYENNELYSKTLLSKIPLKWTGGWHRLDDLNPKIEKDLKLIHLHRMDFEECQKRHKKVKKEKVFIQDLEQKKWGWHHFVSDEDFPKWFYSIGTAKILHAPNSLKNFEVEKQKDLKSIQCQAKILCDIIGKEWQKII
jgi:hypothetical protein